MSILTWDIVFACIVTVVGTLRAIISLYLAFIVVPVGGRCAFLR